MKRIRLFLTTILACLLILNVTQLSAQGPTNISTPADLVALASWVNAGNDCSGETYTLMNDIDLTVYLSGTTEGWSPIGVASMTGSVVNSSSPFSGTFDGGGYTISGLWINQPSEDCVGLFGHLVNATIENLNVEITGSVIGNSRVGGLGGRIVGSTINGCSVTGDVQGVCYVGGFAGQLRDGSSVANSYYAGNVTTTGADVVDNPASTFAGGFAGMIYNQVSISQCFASGTVNVQYRDAGGFVGYALTQTGGDITIENCYAMVNLQSAQDRVGGFAGALEGQNTFNVNITNCYSAGNVVGGGGGFPAVGGFLGENRAEVAITACYYDNAKNPLPMNAVGQATVPSTPDITGLSTYQMVQPGSFTWGIPGAIWSQYQGVSYPYLTATPAPFYPSFSINDCLFVTVSNDTIYYTGSCLDVTAGLVLNIPAGNNVAWDATMINRKSPAFNAALINLGTSPRSEGIFIVSGGIIEGGSYAITGGTEIIIEGGEVRITNTVNGVNAIGAALSVVVEGGIVEALYGTAIALPNSGTAKLQISGGQVLSHAQRPATPYTIGSAGAAGNTLLDNGVVFGTGTTFADVVGGLRYYSTPTSWVPFTENEIQPDGLVIVWDNSAGNVNYMQNTTTDLTWWPSTADVKWNVGSSGISYVNGSNSGFIVMTEVTVNTDISPDFTDPNFQAAVRAEIGIPTGPFTAADVQVITNLDVSGLSIASLAGLGYLTSLDTLDCSNNAFTGGIMPALPNSLTWLNCSNTGLTTLPGLANLTYLDCSNNSIAALPTLPNLTYLDCSNNQLPGLPDLPGTLLHLNVSYNATLPGLPPLPEGLLYFNQSYTQIAIYGTLPGTLEAYLCAGLNAPFMTPVLPGTLTYLDCSHNQIAGLPEMPGGLLYLNCGYNLLPGLVPMPATLETLICNNNLLPGLAAFPGALTYLDCSYNQLTALPGLTALTYLNCRGNQLTGLPTFPGTLTFLDCGNNLLTGLPWIVDLPLTTLNCDSNFLSALPVMPSTLLTLNCSNNNLSGSDLMIGYEMPAGTWNPTTLPAGLLDLDCSYNYLTGLNVSSVSALQDLNCIMNYLGPIVIDNITGTAANIDSLPQRNDPDITPDFFDANFLTAIRELINIPTGPIYASDVANIKVLDISGLGITDITGLAWLFNLMWFDCSDNNIQWLVNQAPIVMGESYVPFPATLTYINASNNVIEASHPWPVSLQYLDISGNQFTALYPLPATLAYFDCSTNLLPGFPGALPAALTYFNCSNNVITGFTPPLPAGLSYYDCSNNLLTALIEPLPLALTYLDCSNNNIEFLPYLIQLSNLAYLNVSNNVIWVLSALPGSVSTYPGVLTTLDCSNNAFGSGGGSNGYFFMGYQTTPGDGTTWVDTQFPSTLITLNCDSNYLQVLDITSATNLVNLSCIYNNLCINTIIGFNPAITTNLSFTPQRGFEAPFAITVTEQDTMVDLAWGTVNRDEKHEIVGDCKNFTQEAMEAFWLGDTPADRAAMRRYAKVNMALGCDFDRIALVLNGTEVGNILTTNTMPELVWVDPATDTTYFGWAINFAQMDAQGVWSVMPGRSNATIAFNVYLNNTLLDSIIGNNLPIMTIADWEIIPQATIEDLSMGTIARDPDHEITEDCANFTQAEMNIRFDLDKAYNRAALVRYVEVNRYFGADFDSITVLINNTEYYLFNTSFIGSEWADVGSCSTSYFKHGVGFADWDGTTWTMIPGRSDATIAYRFYLNDALVVELPAPNLPTINIAEWQIFPQDTIVDLAWGTIARDKDHEITQTCINFTQDEMNTRFEADKEWDRAALVRYVQVNRNFGLDFDSITLTINTTEYPLLDMTYVPGPWADVIACDTTYFKHGVGFANWDGTTWDTIPGRSGAAITYNFYLNGILVISMEAPNLPTITIEERIVITGFPEVLACGVPYVFTVDYFYNCLQNTLILSNFVIDLSVLDSVTMEFSLDGNLWVELPPLGDGKYMLSNTYGYNFPARYYFRATNKGNAAQNFVFNFTANMVDDYTYVSPTEQVYTDVLYTTTASGLVLGAPTIEITQGEFPATIACGTNYDFVITAEGNCYEGTDIRTKIELDPLSAADSLDIYFSPDGSTWLPIEYDSEGISWFGPATGIPFGELIVPFRFVNKGSAENDVPVSVTVSIYECTSDGSSCVADVTSALVTKTYNTVIIGGPSIVYDPELDELPAEIFCGNDYDFAIATTTGCYDDQSLMVIAKIQLSPNVSDLVDVQYWEGGYETGTLYPLPFDENGVTAFGPFDTGFPLSNLTSYFRVASNPTVTEDTPFEVTISLYPIENFSWDGETFTFTGTPLAAMEIASTIMFVPTNTITLISAPGTDAQWTSFEDPIIPIIYATTGATGAEFKGLPDGVTGVWENNEVIITGVPTHPGYYKYTVITTGGCGVDSAMGTIKVCEPYIIDEVNGEQYSIRALQGNCWFTDNLRGYKYNDGSDIEPVPTQYYNEYNPYMPVDVSIFGLLYTWAAAFPEATTKSGEKSLCPDGWHMPSVAELATLTAYDAKDLKNPLYWLTPNNNTNATEFNAVGAGFFNGASNRYEDLYGYTAFWSTANPANMAATVIGAVLTYNCNVIQLLQIPVANAISVRCVMDLDEE